MRRVWIGFLVFSVAIWTNEYQNRKEATAVVSQQEQEQEESMNQQQQQPQAESAPSGPELEGGYRPVVDAEQPYVGLFRSCGAAHGVDPALLAAVAAVESSYRTGVVSHAGAQGLMQFMPKTASAMGVDPWDPSSAICGTAKYLATSIGIHGNWDEAIAAYNAGDPAVTRRGVAAADGTYVADVNAEWAKRRSS